MAMPCSRAGPQSEWMLQRATRSRPVAPRTSRAARSRACRSPPSTRRSSSSGRPGSPPRRKLT
ncbi:hypothetical protein ACFPRL_26695 [Pseudoclavibacter helvolus]